MLSLSQLSPSQVTVVVMADWLGRGAAEQIWKPIWLRSSVVLRWASPGAEPCFSLSPP
uniref:Uncharacterized protein n=1 Tax=Fagus sylvatica TaxID=28930 RepID=A0A2N9EKU5_FAGSY